MIEFPISPTDVGLPLKFSSGWRKNQGAAILRTLDTKKSTVLQICPTGFGKSLVYMATALLTMVKNSDGKSVPGRTLILTSTKGLQDQLLSDFGSCGLVDVRGRNSYTCVHESMNTCEYGPCRIGFKCPDRSICEYEIAKRVATASRLVVTNYAYWLNIVHRGSGLGNFTNIVCDEAHDAPDTVAGYLTTEFDLTRSHIRTYFGKSIPDDEDNEGWFKKLEGVKAQISSEQSKVIAAIADAKLRTGIEEDDLVFDELELSKSDRRALLERKRLLDDIERIVGSDEEWIFERSPGVVKAAPVWVADTARNLLFGKIPKRILSSASVSLKTAEMLGIRADECEVIEYPHTFPIENRMLIHLPTGRINKDVTDLTMKRWLQQIDYIVRDRLDRKGIIHTVSYARRDLVMQHSAYKKYMITHERGNTPEVVRKFKEMRAPAILVSPVMTTGWDFPYGECEFQIIGKIAYPDTRSRIVQARTSQDKEYASYLAMQQLVQACGRGVRTPTDRCENFIIDDSILWFMPRFAKFAPMWFREAYRKMLTSPKPPDKIADSC